MSFGNFYFGIRDYLRFVIWCLLFYKSFCYSGKIICIQSLHLPSLKICYYDKIQYG